MTWPVTSVFATDWTAPPCVQPSLVYWPTWLAPSMPARPKDEEDVTMIVRIHGGSLDYARIRNVLEALQDALGQSDLLPAFARAVAQAAR
jgi:hypothetical protein